MKNWLKGCIDDFIKSTDVYMEIEKEANDYNAECQRKEERIKKLRDDLKQCRAEKQEIILGGQVIIEEKINEIKGLEKQKAILEEKLQTKEQQRRKAVGSIGGCKVKIKKLEEEIKNLNERIEFLKTNRRAPSIEELKDYDFKRKKSVTK